MGGTAPERDFAAAVRPVLFYTDIEEFQYATHGGTAFVVSYQGRPYALTCRHVFKDFDEGQLTLFGAQFPIKGDQPAKIRGVYYPSSPRASAVDSDVTDFCLIEFETNVTTDFFGGNAYPLSEQTICSSTTGDRLLIFGALKEKTVINPSDITVGYGRLEASDAGPSSDPFLRRGAAQYLGHEFSTVTGISGAPVFNLRNNRLCGMIVRGGLTAGRFSVHYAGALDILRFAEAAFERRQSVFYTRPPHV
jgi:Trypsin-like peptidase domain